MRLRRSVGVTRRNRRSTRQYGVAAPRQVEVLAALQGSSVSRDTLLPRLHELAVVGTGVPAIRRGVRDGDLLLVPLLDDRRIEGDALLRQTLLVVGEQGGDVVGVTRLAFDPADNGEVPGVVTDQRALALVGYFGGDLTIGTLQAVRCESEVLVGVPLLLELGGARLGRCTRARVGRRLRLTASDVDQRGR